jgi:flagellin-like hook-associated protein FlgL
VINLGTSLLDAINLTTSVRENLLALQQASNSRAQSARRLSTGQRVNTVQDNPASFFQAKSLTDRASGLFEAKNDIDQAISSVQAASAGIEALDDITRQLRGIALAARGGTDEQRQAASERFELLRTQLDELSRDISYSGVNLVQSSPDTQSVDLNETGSANLSISGRDSSTGGLGIGSASSFNNFASDQDIDRASAILSDATQSLRSNAASFGSHVALLSERQDFADSLSSTLQGGAAKLVDADLNEEAAKQLSAQVREQLSTGALQISGNNERLLSSLLF